jgi:hypothetical protein
MISYEHRIEAERLRLGLLWGCEDPATVIAWADAVIRDNESPDYIFTDISATPEDDYGELTELLDKLGQRAEHIDALRTVFGRISYLAAEEAINLKKVGNFLAKSEFYNSSEDIADLGMTYEIESEISGTVKQFKEHLKSFETENSSSPEWYSASFK